MMKFLKFLNNFISRRDKMLSYHNDENLKNLLVSEMIKHKEQDQFIKGVYSKINGKFKGCSVGCTIDSINKILGKTYSNSSHESIEESVGIPTWLAKVQDVLFEGIPDEEGAQFSIDFLSAIPVGVSLELVKWKFCAFILKECIDRVSTQENISEELKEQVLKAIRDVLSLHENAIETGKFEHQAVESAAESAAWSAWSAARSASVSAARSAWSAARSVESAAESAAWSAWSAVESAVESAARSAVYKRYADEIIRLLKESGSY